MKVTSGVEVEEWWSNGAYISKQNPGQASTTHFLVSLQKGTHKKGIMFSKGFLLFYKLILFNLK